MRAPPPKDIHYKNSTLTFRVSSVIKRAAIEMSCRHGFDSLAQVLRLLLAAYADGRIKPEFSVQLLKDTKGNEDKTVMEEMIKKHKAVAKAEKERREYQKELEAKWAELNKK